MLLLLVSTAALHMPVATGGISSTPIARAASPTMMAATTNKAVTPLDADSFAPTLFDSDFDGLAVVKFYAPWCRTCRSTGPQYDRMVTKITSETSSSEVRFFEVDFKESKALCLKERVFALPAVHFYTRSLGRINRFTLSPVNTASKMRREIDRYIGESQHLNKLKALESGCSSAISPLIRWNYLVGLLEALSNADTYMAALEEKDSSTLVKLFESDETRLAELQATFDWIDANGDGQIDADELLAVASAVSRADLEGGADADETSQSRELYGTMLEAALARAGMRTDEAAGAEEDETKQVSLEARPLDFATFVHLMTSKAVTEFRKPDTELLPAFAALDADNDGVITREEIVRAMRSVANALPGVSDFEAEAVAAFDALDRDQSGTLDYEEFVAMLSGSSPYGGAI